MTVSDYNKTALSRGKQIRIGSYVCMCIKGFCAIVNVHNICVVRMKYLMPKIAG